MGRERKSGARTRKYNGREYKLARRVSRKDIAERHARERRKEGWAVRVEHEGAGYSIYTRRKESRRKKRRR